MSQISISPILDETIKKGEAILFLGAGTTIAAEGADKDTPFTGERLRDALSDKFLGGRKKEKPLAQVAEYAKSESSLFEVQSFIKSVFEPLRPAHFHNLIPQLRWHSLVTTNFDEVVERAYTSSNRLQELAPIRRDGDDFSKKIRDPRAVPYLKLHGCISIINDPSLPLILASEEYARHRNGRQRLFQHFQDWALEHPVIFCGYDISDPHVQEILFDLTDQNRKRPRYMVVNPNIDDIDQRYWGSRRVDAVKATFKEFMEYLDRSIPHNTRKLASIRERKKRPFDYLSRVTTGPSNQLKSYLDSDLTHVSKGMSTEGVRAKQFYKGLDKGWGFLAIELDVRRKVTDDILSDAVLDISSIKGPTMFLLKGYAGSGKSITLKRVAWDAAHDYNTPVFFLEEGGALRFDLLEEIYWHIQQPFLLVVDDVTIHLDELRETFDNAATNRMPMNIVLGARTNEWNVYGEPFDARIERQFEMRRLSKSEIEVLLGKLESHGELGHLAEISVGERIEYFLKRAERELLVALHEATEGKKFEEIVYDEFQNLTPPEAKVIYLDICTLHRLNVPFRAGLMSRVSGVRLEDFRQRLLAPLEYVVRVYRDTRTRDFMYRTRHSVIADWVFRQAISDPESRLEQILRIMKHMNLDYSSDERAFGELVKGRLIADLFGDRLLADKLYDTAVEVSGNRAFTYQQRAVFELAHPAGRAEEAHKYILLAKEKDPTNPTIIHTHFSVLRDLARQTNNRLQRERYREEAKSLLRGIPTYVRNSHFYSTSAAITLDEVDDFLDMRKEKDDALNQRLLGERFREAEEVIRKGLQSCPDDEYLLQCEARLASLLKDKPRTAEALYAALKGSSGSPFTSIAYARHLRQTGKRREAIKILEESLHGNPLNKELHLEIAKQLMAIDEVANLEVVGQHLKQSFDPGDSNYDAQFWYARFMFLHGEADSAMKLFQSLGRSVPMKTRSQRRGLVRDSRNKPVEFRGFVSSHRDNYIFLTSEDLKGDVFCPLSSFQSDWDSLFYRAEVVFQLSFTFRGPIAERARMAH